MPYSSASPDFDPGKCTVKQLRLRIRIEGTIPPLADARPLGKLDAFKLALTDECPLELCEGPHHGLQQLRHRRICAGE